MTILYWLRHDLRLHDNELLAALPAAGATRLLPVVCFDPAALGPDRYLKLPKMGPHRLPFWLESLADLQKSYAALGSDLHFVAGSPAEVLPALARQIGAGAVWTSGEFTTEEADTEAAVEAALGARIPLRRFENLLLLHPDDLSIKVRDLPLSFSKFRPNSVVLPASDARLRSSCALKMTTSSALQKLPHLLLNASATVSTFEPFSMLRLTIALTSSLASSKPLLVLKRLSKVSRRKSGLESSISSGTISSTRSSKRTCMNASPSMILETNLTNACKARCSPCKASSSCLLYDLDNESGPLSPLIKLLLVWKKRCKADKSSCTLLILSKETAGITE